MSHRLTLTWPGGEHEFALGIGQLRAVQDATNAGPEELLYRMAGGKWRVDDLIAILRLGLEGGGMPKAECGPLVLRMVELHGLIAFRETAYRVLGAALIGPGDDPVGEQTGESAPPENGASPASTSSAA